MSRRNTRAGKSTRRVQKALRSPLDGYTDLVQWIKLRERCSTNTALGIIISGALEVDGVKLRSRYIPSDLTSRIQIVDPFAAVEAEEAV